MVLVELKVWTFQMMDLAIGMDIKKLVVAEKTGEFPLLTFPNNDAHDFISISPQNLAKCDGLGHVAPAFPLNDE